jgi:hypothetical protein
MNSRAKSGADQSIEYPRTPQPDNSRIEPGDRLELKYNNGVWHIFTSTHHRSKCLCGKKKKGDFPRNHCTKKRTAQQILDQPDQGLGHVSKTGVEKLERKVNA